MIRELNKNMYKEMTNPYLHAYLLLLEKDHGNWKRFFNEYDNTIDPYDYFTLIFRFLPEHERKKNID